MAIISLYIFLAIWNVLSIKCKVLAPSVVVDAVVKISETTAIAMGCRALPDNFILKGILAKDLVKEDFNVWANVVIEMYVDRSSTRHHAFNCTKVFIHPVEVTFLVPDVTVHLFFKRTKSFIFKPSLCISNLRCEIGIATDENLLRIVCSRGKRRIDVYQIDRFHLA